MARNYSPVKLAFKKYEPEGSGDSTPVILLHSTSISKEHWGDIPQIVANKTIRKVYTYDARNHGDSEWSGVFNFDILADDLFHFLDTVGVKKAILVGHSMGAITTIKAALKNPERIEKIIVEDMYAKKIPSEFLEPLVDFFTCMQNVVKHIPAGMTEEEAKHFCEEELSRMLPNESEFLEKLSGGTEKKPRYLFSLKKDSRGGYAHKANFDAIIEALKNPDTLQSDLTGRYDGEAHFIYGTFSAFNVPGDADNIRKHFPKAEFTAIEKASHSVHDDQPKEFMNALLKSLS